MKNLFCLLALFFSQTIFAQQRPNILVIFTDDHAQQTISAYGNQLVTTPNIDRIANAGIRFSNSFVTNSICAPSRAVLLTGKYSHLNGKIDNTYENIFDGSQQQVQKILQKNGYQTAWVGKWHLQSLPQGFDYWKILPGQGFYYNPNFINMQGDTVKSTGYATDLITDNATAWLADRDASKPFFLVVGEKATHREWVPDLQDLGAYDEIEFPMPENFYDRYEKRRAAYEQDMTIDKTMRLKEDLKVNLDYKSYGYNRLTPEQMKTFKPYYEKITREYESVKDNGDALLKWKYQRYIKEYLMTAKSLDRNVGKILDYLEANNLMDNTIVIYTSDQGFYMGEHGWFDKRFMYEESLRTPFLIKFPGRQPRKQVVDEMILNLDIAPTVLQAANIAVPKDMQGLPIQTLLTGDKPGNWRSAIYYHYYEYPEPHRAAPHAGIRTAQYKLIRFYGPFNEWEFYDLKTDPSEMKNEIGNPQYSDIIQELKKELYALAKHYKDDDMLPLLEVK